MIKNLFLTLLLAISSICGNVPSNNKKHQINPRDKAVLRILQYRQNYLPQGAEKIKNDSFLAIITDELPGSIENRINHLKIHGIKDKSTREAAIRLAERYLAMN